MDNSNEKNIGMKGNCIKQIVEPENAELEKEQIDEMLSTSMKETDEIGNEEQKAKKSIKFGGFLPDVLDWIKRMELCQSALSYFSRAFNFYCWPHLHGRKVKPRIVKKLVFKYKKYGGNWQKILEKDNNILIPIAIINPPEYINGFEHIIFDFLDNQALQFMEKILPLLKEIELNFQSYESFLYTIPIKRLVRLLAPKTIKLEIFCTFLYNFNNEFPGLIFGLQSIYIFHYKETDLDLIMEWLHAPREDGKHKMLVIHVDLYLDEKNLINRVKEDFSKSIEPVNYTIRMSVYYHEYNEVAMDEFKIENDVTDEILELECKQPRKYVLYRYQKGNEKVEELEGNKNSTYVKIGS